MVAVSDFMMSGLDTEKKRMMMGSQGDEKKKMVKWCLGVI